MHTNTLRWITTVVLWGTLLPATAPAQQQPGAAVAVPRVASAAAPTSTNIGGGNPGLQPPLAPEVPPWIPLNEKHQEYVYQILRYWESKSTQVKRYRCNFRRWEYDPVFGPRETFKTYGEGVIKYSAPDKGLFRVEKMWQYQAPQQPGGKADYAPADKDTAEHWACDGHWVYEFDYRRKELLQSELPPDMRGQAIGSGPLPFLFNAKADDIQRRFWVRVITPPDAQKEYHLEAVPRTQEDAANFKMVHVIIDETDFLPKAMVLFDRNFNPNTPTRTTFEFTDREVNFSVLAEKLIIWHREFYEPALPAGWVKKVSQWNQPVAPTAGVPPTGPSPAAGDPSR